MVNIEKIWEAYNTQLSAFIHKRVADPTLCDDILQDVFIKLHENLHNIRDDQKLSAWLYQVARNTIIDHYRTYKPAAELPAELMDEAPTPNDTAVQELSCCFEIMIDQLPEPYREAIYLSEIHGLKHKEVAEQLDISLTAAKSRVRRGREQLKDIVEACCTVKLDARGSITDYEPNL